jgi:hypothetical protein
MRITIDDPRLSSAMSRLSHLTTSLKLDTNLKMTLLSSNETVPPSRLLLTWQWRSVCNNPKVKVNVKQTKDQSRSHSAVLNGAFLENRKRGENRQAREEGDLVAQMEEVVVLDEGEVQAEGEVIMDGRVQEGLDR